MANTFKNYVVQMTTADSPTTIMTVAGSTTTIVIGLRVANKTAANIKVAVYLDVSSTNYHLTGSDTVIPPGSALVISEAEKIVCETTDKIEVECDTTNGCDVVLSCLEIT